MANNTAQPFRFTGELQDPEVRGTDLGPDGGLYYLRARFYDPANGRFMSRDPLPGFLGKPQTLNAYAYATNNPVMFRDPSGLCSLCDWVGDHRESISTGVQLADLVPLGQIPLINIPLTIPSVILDVTAFGFLEYDILTSSCSSQRKRELTADNVANLTTGASAQALSVIASPTIAGSWAISTGGSAIEGLIYLSTSEALAECRAKEGGGVQ